jgi:ATP-dependent DNA helicase RecG
VTTTLADLQRWMTAPHEDEHLEFKEAKASFAADKALQYFAALANEGGGRLVLGVSDKSPRTVVGSTAFQDLQTIRTTALNKLHIRIDVEEFAHADGRVVVFHVPPRGLGAPVAVDGAYYMRSGEQLVAMSSDRLRQIFDEGKPDWAMRAARVGCSPDDVVALLDTQSYFDMQELPYPTTREGVIERLESEKLIAHEGGAWDITNLGAILFAKRLDQFDGLARKAARVIVYDGAGKLQTKLDQPGIKGYAVGFAGLLEFINGQVPANEVIGQALRREVKMFPEIALRELVANALIHQDFSEHGASVMIELYSDRIEISNPGRPEVPTERFIDGYRSRNERVADLMRRLRICEEKGSGIDKVINAVEVFQLPAPDFRVSDHRTSAIMFAHKAFEKMDGDERVRAAYQHCCLRYVTNQRMTNQSLRDRFKLPEAKSETISRVIRDAVDAGRVKPEDATSKSKKFARYVPFWA